MCPAAKINKDLIAGLIETLIKTMMADLKRKS